MNFVKALLFLLVSSLLFADEIPFTVSGTPATLAPSVAGAAPAPTNLDDPQQQGELIAQLKLRAVSEWLQGYLGNRYPQFERFITNDFAEKYVLEYKVSRAGANREAIQLNGHLDGDSLKRWVRVVESKKGGTTVKPLLVLSSSLTQFPLSPAASTDRARDNVFGQQVSSFMNHEFQRMNTHLTPVESSFPLNSPARFENEIRTLRDFGVQSGGNCVVWVHLSPCSSCAGNSRTDIYLYSLNAPRLVFVESDDLPLKAQDYSNQERVKEALKTVFQQFHASFDSVVSEGKLLNSEFRVLFEGLDHVRSFKVFESELARSDFASQPILRKAEARSAEFSVLSPLGVDELAQRIQNIEMAGRKLSAQRIDSRSVVVRYLK